MYFRGLRMSQSVVSYLWREPNAAKAFRTGVSLHSHTSHSKETLDFIADLSAEWKFLPPIMRWLEERSHRCSGIRPDYHNSYWTPPLTPRLAYDLESNQIQNSLQLPALVSITDHDDIGAPLLLNSILTTNHTPISVEWTVPFADGAFHIGVHNLPRSSATQWMERLAAYTAAATAGQQQRNAQKTLSAIFADLHALPQVLIIFNHPLWDLYRVGKERHYVLVNDFLVRYGQHIHALELNGLRDWNENRELSELAERWNQLTISGGDRHGIEPNANINLTSATTFDEFVHEVRRDRRSHVLFMPQYAEPWKHRILQSTLDAIRNHPDFPVGSQRWDERVYHPDAKGNIAPLSQLWNDGTSPVYITAILAMVRLLGRGPISRGLRLAWDDSAEMHAILAKLDA
jgi:hypothetical protein